MSANSKLLDTYLGTVDAWECDNMGHMNVRFYIARFGQATGQFANAIGLAPGRQRGERLALAALESRILFQREAHAGDVLRMRTGLRDLSSKTALMCHQLLNIESGVVAASSETTVALFDLAARKVRPWAGDLRSSLERLRDPCVEIPEPRDLETKPIPMTPVAGMFETNRSAVNSWEIDHLGHMSAEFYITRFSDAANHLLSRLGVSAGQLRDRNWGMAALDYRLRFLRELSAGDSIVVRSAMHDVGRKVYRFFHHLCDVDTGEVVTTLEVAGLFFDKSTRKSFDLPPEIRARAEGLLVEWSE